MKDCRDRLCDFKVSVDWEKNNQNNRCGKCKCILTLLYLILDKNKPIINPHPTTRVSGGGGGGNNSKEKIHPFTGYALGFIGK